MKSPFRAVRQKLFTEGKLVRYLGYALGEVMLIIVGILFALKINDWNADRKAQAEFDEYIVQLKEDVATAIENVDTSIRLMEGFLERSKYVLAFLKASEHDAEDLVAFKSGLTSLSGYNRPQVFVGLLGRLLDGDMEIIARDPVLARHALEMESRVESRLSNQENVSGQIDIASGAFNKFRGRGSASEGFDSEYDLKLLRSSPEFRYTVLTVISRKSNMKDFSVQIAASLKSFQAVLAAYE